MIENQNFTSLSPFSIGRIAEYWAKLALTLKGYDVYTSEVDDKGIDFVAKNSLGNFINVQVKSARLESTSYIFIAKKAEWENALKRNDLFLALVLFQNNEYPRFYLIPSTAWKKENDLLRDRKYDKGQKSVPEWGLNISKKNLTLLEAYKL